MSPRRCAGAQQYNIYVTTSSVTWYLVAGTSVQSGVSYTGQQTANSWAGSGSPCRARFRPAANQPPRRADTGTGREHRMEGLIPVLGGLSATGAGPYANVGFESSGVWQGGYINQSVGTHLSTNAMFTALDGLWENNGMNNVTPGVPG